MDRIERILSRPVAKPYRSKGIDPDEKPHLNEDGHLDFAEGDVENPKNWSTIRKAYITFVAVMLVVNATFASSSPSGSLVGIAEYFNVSEEAGGLVTTLFLLGYCAGPLIFAPLSEFYGRRWVFYITFTFYVAFNFLCAFANNFAALLIGRFLTGTFASAPLANSPGVLADIWGPIERANAMAIFAIMTFAGPALGPIISGFLELKEDWRWTFYVLLWLGGATELLMFTLPETLSSVVLLNKARRIRKAQIPGFENVIAPIESSSRKLSSIFRVALTRPWKILVDPISLLVAIYMSVVYALLYMLFTIYPIVFQQKRGWNSGVGALPLIGTVLGAVIGGMIIFAVSARDSKRMLAGYKSKPEDRLQIAMFAGILFAVTMFWFAWTAEFNSIHWIVPTIAGMFLATSIMLLFVAYLNYLTDTYLMYTASAMAANTICRSACGAAAPLFTQYMFDSLGVGGGGSLIGGFAALLAPIPFIFYRYGEGIRKRSKFAPTGPPPAPDDEEKQDVASDRQPRRESSNASDSDSTGSASTRTASVAGADKEHEGLNPLERTGSSQETEVGRQGSTRVDANKNFETIDL